MKKIFAIIGAIITGGISIGIALIPHMAEAGCMWMKGCGGGIN